jgi:hypothetical protein
MGHSDRKFVRQIVDESYDGRIIVGHLRPEVRLGTSKHWWMFLVLPAGSAKTSAMRVIRMLVDPHEVMERRFSIVRDLMHGLANHHVLALENVSEIKPDLSDTICALNTGTGYAERKYYTQYEEFQARGHMPVHINGIPGRLAEREDLIDRAVTFAFEFISDEDHRTRRG